MTDTHTSDETNNETSSAPTPVVVGIGASSGGLSALKKLVTTIPVDSGVAYVIVFHLSPEHDSHLAELLQPHSPIPVMQVTGEVLIEPNQIYVIPPGKNLDPIDSHLRISQIEQERRKRAPIDHFFRALAGTHDGNAVAIILTGTGSDGTLGIQEVKGMGGLTVVQDPVEAECDGMPQSALSTGVIDLVLPLSDMISYVLKYLTTQPRLFVPNDDDEKTRPALSKTLAIIREKVGSDFTRYKQSTIMRRIRRRMQLANIEEINEYLNLLNTNPDEVVALANDFLINVTSFFRDQNVFEELEHKIIPELFKGKLDSDFVRVWSVGCATGEEAYSLAMLLHEHAEKIPNPPQIQIFASDLHEFSLKKAREGLYSGDIETDISSERLDKFFRKENGSYRIRSDIRDHIVFSPHNLLADPPFSRVDLVLCRNVLIYLERNLQPDIIRLFHYSLKPNGYLVLGTAESINQSDLFTTENKANGIYLKRNVPCPESRLSVFPIMQSKGNNLNQLQTHSESLSYGALHHRMVERYAQPSILVNSENKVVHLSSRAGRYLTHPGGMPTTTIFKLVRDELQAEVRAILHMASERSVPYKSRPVKLKIEGDLREVVIHACQNFEEGSGFTLLIFEEREVTTAKEGTETDAQGGIAQPELEIELELTKRRLQAAIDEYETSQEEMRASNEELLSANEELRSTLEELETSKEELQSINEELQTANQENRHKVAELGQITDDLQHLMSATHIATLFLDRKLRILRFTPQVGELFNLRAMDRGRPISDLTHRLSYDDLMKDAAEVLEKLTPSDREVKDTKGNWYLARMRPYRTADDRIEGVVLTFVDITARKESEIALRQSEERYRVLFEAMDEGFCVVEKIANDNSADDFKVLVANPAFQKLTGFVDAEGRCIKEIVPGQLGFWKDIFNRLDNSQESTHFECENHYSQRWFEISLFRLPNVYGPHIAVLLKDIHDQKRIEEELRASAQRDAFRVALADAFRVATDPAEVQQISCRMLGEYLNVNSVIYTELSAENDLINEHEYTRPNTRIDGRFYAWRNNELLNEKFLAGETIAARDIRNFPALTSQQLKLCHSLNIATFISIPIVHDEQIVAALNITHSKPCICSESEILLIKEVAERTFDAIDRVRAEQAVCQREIELREADARKNEFIAVLSHELRNPLAPILNALHIIEAAEIGSKASTDAQVVVRRHVGLMSRLIDDLLDITRIAQGKIQLKTTKLELNKIISQTVRDHSSIFEKNELTLTFNPAPEDTWVKGDRSRLSQAIGNILHNCAKFTSAGGSTSITVSTEENNAVIIIKDSGVGMTSEFIEQMFKPFVQGEATLDRSKGGLGLGLALCKRLIELHRGTISALSDGIGHGAEFHIRLPLVDAPQRTLKKVSKNSQIIQRRILITEDNEDSADTLGALLEFGGHDVSITYDGPNGIDRAREFMPDFVVCDIGLPDLNGYEVARKFKTDEDLNQITLIALSGYAMPEDLKRAREAGFDHYLKKPADIKKLEEILGS
ncbi:MAG: response regulator [Gammaproteobacteria bacterium]|nr:MAG: response regulator [Gammaproteobacteria bacterium]